LSRPSSALPPARRLAHRLSTCEISSHARWSSPRADSATYTATAALPSSTDACLRAATALAIVGLRVVDDAAFRERVRTSWEAQMEEQKTLEAAMA
jgi:hypothetical protein